ncbi:MAG: tetratricopeptide repeat protein [Pseudomonadota bacterium]
MSSLSVALAVLSVLQYGPVTEAGRAVKAEEDRRLAACLDLVQTDPEQAYENGLSWLSDGGRPGARHCTALALIALGHPGEGAARLEDLANAPDGGDVATRRSYLGQAGNAWLLAGAPEAALVALDNALKLGPGNPALRLDRALALVSMERTAEAISALDRLETDGALTAEGYGLRARAHVELEQYDAALRDVAVARRTLPEDIDLLVLRGEIREAQRLSQR